MDPAPAEAALEAARDARVKWLDPVVILQSSAVCSGETQLQSMSTTRQQARKSCTDHLIVYLQRLGCVAANH